jgi:hypothetical protein
VLCILRPELSSGARRRTFFSWRSVERLFNDLPGKPQTVSDSRMSLDDLDLPAPESDAEMAERHARVRAVAVRATDPWSAIWDTDKGMADLGMHPAVAQELDSQLQTHKQSAMCPLEPADDFWVEVCDKWARYAQRIGLMPKSDKPFAWAHILCLLAPVVGQAGWPRISQTLAEIEPACPLDEIPPTDQELVQAHQDCGWPLGLSWLPGHVIAKATAGCFASARWLRACALLHVLKYTRCTQAGAVSVILEGQVSCTGPAHRAEITGRIDGFVGKATAAALGASKTSTKNDPQPWTDAVLASLASLTREELIRTQRPLEIQVTNPRRVLLPGAGREANHPHADRWLRHGLAVSGVLTAGGGQVVASPLDDRGVTAHEWEPMDRALVDQAQGAVPATYSPRLPSAYIAEACHNIRPVGVDHTAYWSVIDAVMLCGVNCPLHAALERPLIFCSPVSVDPADMTNTGKTTLALALAKVFSPGIQSAIQAQGTGDPAQRAIAAELLAHGTAAVDEFVLQPQGMLGENNLFSLATGAAIQVGQVYANTGSNVRLRYPLVLTTKVLHAREDLYNRSVCVRLTPFTQVLSGTVRHELVSGSWSLSVRFAALDIWSALDLAAVAESAKHAGTPTNGWRWPVHRYVAAAIYDHATGQTRTEDECFAAVDAAARACSAAMDKHATDAADEGVDLYRPMPRLSLRQVFATLDSDELAVVFPQGEPRAIRDAIHEMLKSWGGDVERMVARLGVPRGTSLKSMARALTASLRSLPVDGTLVLDDGQQVTRHNDRNRHLVVAVDYSKQLRSIADIIP